MEYTYKFTREICHAAAKAQYWKLSRRIGIGVVILAALFDAFVLVLMSDDDVRSGIAISQSLESNPVVLITLALLFCLIAFAFIYPHWRGATYYSSSPARDGLVHISLTPQQLSVKVEAGANSSFGWDFYKKWRESKKVFLVIAKGGATQFLPKEGLTAEQIAEIRTILAARISKS